MIHFMMSWRWLISFDRVKMAATIIQVTQVINVACVAALLTISCNYGHVEPGELWKPCVLLCSYCHSQVRQLRFINREHSPKDLGRHFRTFGRVLGQIFFTPTTHRNAVDCRKDGVSLESNGNWMRHPKLSWASTSSPAVSHNVKYISTPWTEPLNVVESTLYTRS